MRVSEFFGLDVRTESGESLGRVHDVRAEVTTRSLRVTGLVVGRVAVFERLGVRAVRSSARLRSHDVVPWSAVVRADRRGIVVRDGTTPG